MCRRELHYMQASHYDFGGRRHGEKWKNWSKMGELLYKSGQTVLNLNKTHKLPNCASIYFKTTRHETHLHASWAQLPANRNPLDCFDQSSFMTDFYTKFYEEYKHFGSHFWKFHLNDVIFILLLSNPLS